MEAHNRYSAREALEKLSANSWMAERGIACGQANMAGRYASVAAHYGLMLLEPCVVRRHIDGAISHDDMVSDPQHLSFAELILASLGGAL